jgi:ADP-ribose pyrophosphatase YjhB (NUDIX family)
MENNAKFKVRWIIFKDNKVLLGKDVNWGLIVPWWTMDIWELIEECFLREIFEETWIIAKKGDLYGIYDHFSKSKKTTSISAIYYIDNPNDFINIDLSVASHWHENEYFKYMSLEEIDKKIIEYWIDIFPYGVYKDIKNTLLKK